jgi:flagellar motility protein MotE (MotC chaperone)
MSQATRRFAVLLLVSVATGVAVWALLRFTAPRFRLSADPASANLRSVDELWSEGVQKVKADRGEAEKNTAVESPPELRHYEDRRWFLATQIAEVHKQNVQSCQDYLELAAMIQSGEMVTVPAATEDYILFGVGAKADEGPFSRYENDHSIALFDETQLGDEYARLNTTRSKLQNEIADLMKASAALKKRERAKQRETQKEIASRQQQLKSSEEEKAQLDQFYGQTESRQRLFAEYQSLQRLARNFGGRSYDLVNSNDRQALKVNMLRSMRPAAFKVMKEIAVAYHREFDRPLPVSSLVRPEEYQRALRKVNRGAPNIDTPPHSTGLAFDIDYRYMGAAEQMFVMKELARLKNEGRIEVLRERAANYHVFVFIDGTRPRDDMIRASLDQVGGPAEETNRATKPTAKVKIKSQKVIKKTTKPKKKRRR